jgi:peptidoglycan hydrolase CwlO-like protein
MPILRTVDPPMVAGPRPERAGCRAGSSQGFYGRAAGAPSALEAPSTHMRSKAIVLVLVSLAAALAAGAPSRAGVSQQLEHAREQRRAAVDRVRALEQDLSLLLARYGDIERRAGHAAIRLVDRSRAVEAAGAAVAEAQERLDDRVRATYEFGSASLLEAYLSAETFADLSVAHEYTSRTLAVDAVVLDRLERAEEALRDRQDAAERAAASLAAQRKDMQQLLGDMRRTLNRARRVGDRFGLVVKHLENQQRAIDEASARESGLGMLGVGATGADQSSLLALLGPTEGRTCETPNGLTDTGRGFSGEASWYGWEFAGQTTASGAIFDPRLFTAANPWLPFGTFLRVHRGDRCAIVLVNDRGPYVDGRAVDLSMAAAEYLDVGVSDVTADILVPTDGIPA